MTGGEALDPEISKLVNELMPQARSEAWKVFSGAPHALDLDELTSLAYTGLMMATARWPLYCAERGFNPGCGQVPCAEPAACGTRFFAAYCLRRIRGAMLDAMRSADWVTRSMRSRAKQLREAGQDLGRSEAELVADTGLSKRQIRDTLAGVAARPVSFDSLQSEGAPHDVPDSGDVEGQVVVSSVLDAVLAEMATLDSETQVVLALRFHQGLELAEIAERLGVPEQRVADLHNAGVVAVHDVMLRAVTLGGDVNHGGRITGMSLTPAELSAARAFRDTRRFTFGVRADNAPADVTVDVLVRFVRHDCPEKGGRSLGIELREHYVYSPEFVVHSHEGRTYGVAMVDDGAGADWPEEHGFTKTVLPARRFGWLWTEGKCGACGLTARSGAGRLVDPAERPPAPRALVS